MYSRPYTSLLTFKFLCFILAVLLLLIRLWFTFAVLQVSTTTHTTQFMVRTEEESVLYLCNNFETESSINSKIIRRSQSFALLQPAPGVQILGVGGPGPLKIGRRGQSMFCTHPLKMSHSFIQNWSCLCWRCYYPYVWSAPSRQCPPVNAFAAILGLKLSWPKTKLQYLHVCAGDPPWAILIDGVPVEGVGEFIYFGSNQSSIGYCRPVFSTQDWTSLFSD